MEETQQQFSEKAQRLSNLLQRITEILQVANRPYELDQLLDTSVNLIRDQLGCYYVGLFLVDDSQQWVGLRAGTGEAGQIMINWGHPRKISDTSSVEGWVAQNRQPLIMLDVGEDAVYFGNPVLPHTRSRIVLPLTTEERVIGVLDIQSAEEATFCQEDIPLLQPIADQLAETIRIIRT